MKRPRPRISPALVGATTLLFAALSTAALARGGSGGAATQAGAAATATATRTVTTGVGARPAPGAVDSRAAQAAQAVAGEARVALRSALRPDGYGALVRAAGLAVNLATGHPGRALSAALGPQAPVLTVRPVDGPLSSGYGMRRDPFHRRRRERHKGVDLVATRGTPVHAAGPGMVVRARREHGYGRVVYIDHGGGLQTRYAHLQRILVHEGEFVPAAALVGQVGSSGHATGPHLHFEVRENGVAVPPARILEWLMPAPPAAAATAPARHHHARRHHTPHPPHILRSQQPQS